MGLFRLILALVVVVAHGTEMFGAQWQLSYAVFPVKIWSGAAVFAFFILSGFYMSLTFHAKYQYEVNAKSEFYLSRALRLYPTHLAVLLLYALVYWLSSSPLFLLGDLPDSLFLSVSAISANILIFGVEMLPFSNTANWSLVLGPTWSLSLELYFYILAPFIVMRSLKALLIGLCLAVALRFGLVLADVPLLPWRYFFFPASLVFFLLGCCAFRIYALLPKRMSHPIYGLLAALLLALTSCSPWFWSEADLDAKGAWMFYVSVFFASPLLFLCTQKSRLDKFLGDLAYPVYLSHGVVLAALKMFGIPAFLDVTMTAILFTLVLSLILHYLSEEITRHIRQIMKQRIAAHALQT